MREKGEFSFHSFPVQQGRQWGPGWLHPLTNAASQAVTQQTWTYKSSLDLPYSSRLDSKFESVTKILVSRNLQCNTKRCNRYFFLLLSPSPYSRGCCQTTLTARPDLGEAEPRWRLLNTLQPLSSKQVYFFFLTQWESLTENLQWVAQGQARLCQEARLAQHCTPSLLSSDSRANWE